jgi:[lysine-biosynthesis-protein LysW]--L-2-aminoadipate ligase
LAEALLRERADGIACMAQDDGLVDTGSPRLLVAAADTNEASVLLAAGWRERGLDAERVSPPDLRGHLRPADTVLGRLDVLPTLDGVEPGLLELLLLERAGVHVLNRAAALLRTHDKLRTAACLASSGIPHPRTLHVGPRRGVPALGTPVVLKPRFGSWGKDVFVCRSDAELATRLDDVRDRSWFRRHGALLQELVPPRGHDLRLVVARGVTVGAAVRVAAPGEWRTNVSLGGSRRAAVPTAEASSLAAAAAAAVGADLVGVDLLPVDGGYVVLELNGAVEFDLDYSLPGADAYVDAARALGFAACRGSRAFALAV